MPKDRPARAESTHATIPNNPINEPVVGQLQALSGAVTGLRTSQSSISAPTG